jgi:hypothetical protein
MEAHTDRPGSDLKLLELPQPDPELCRAACDGMAQCKSFTYVKPRGPGSRPRCYLKSQVAAAKPDTCCVSGVKPQLPPGFEVNTDRPGKDLKVLELPQPNPELCRDACQEEAACKAFTYVKPGAQVPGPRCHLKSEAPPAQPSDCCASGVKG